MSAAKPITAPVQVQVVDLSDEGRGIARHEGRVVFIDDALPGETVEIQIFRRRKGVEEARLINILQPSPDRVTPKCSHFGLCGGCAEEHLAPARQIELKQSQLLQTLARVGRVQPASILPPLQASTWAYRRRARLGVRWVPQKGRVLVGFRERANSRLADLRKCEVLQPPLGELILPLSELIGALSLRDRVPQVEAAVADNVTALVMRVLDEPTPADLALLREFAGRHRVQIYLQPGGYDSIAPLDPDAVQPLLYALPEFELEFEFLPNDFIQVNAELNRRMVGTALRQLNPEPQDTVLDLFCGLGNFSLPLARRAKQVLGVEGELSLVERARRNAARNGIANAQFIAANLFEDQSETPWGKGSYNKVLLDPPRAGAREVLPLVARDGAERIVYISCHPGSLARDAGMLVNELGYTLIAAGVLDMFPHTAHVESMAVFERS